MANFGRIKTVLFIRDTWWIRISGRVLPWFPRRLSTIFGFACTSKHDLIYSHDYHVHTCLLHVPCDFREPSGRYIMHVVNILDWSFYVFVWCLILSYTSMTHACMLTPPRAAIRVYAYILYMDNIPWNLLLFYTYMLLS